MGKNYLSADEWLSGKRQADSGSSRDNVPRSSGKYQSAEEWLAGGGQPEYNPSVEAAANNVQSWLNKYNTALTGFHAYRDAMGDRWDADYGGEWYKKLLEAKDEYNKYIRADAVKIGYDGSLAFRDLQNITGDIQKHRDTLSQFDSDDSYQKALRQAGWYEKYSGLDYKGLTDTAAGISDKEEREFVNNMAANARYDYLRRFDETGAQNEIDALQQELEDLNTSGYNWLDNPELFEQAKNSAEDRDQNKKKLEQRIMQLQQDMNESRRVKKNAEMSGVGMEGADNYDSSFAQLSQYRGSSDLSQFINREETAQERKHRKGQEAKFGRNEYSNKNYDLLTNEEKAVFNYWDGYDAQNGTNRAQEYLDTLEETLNYRSAQEWTDSVKDAPLLGRLAYYGTVGAEGAVRGMGNLPKLLNGSEEYTPQSATQMAAGMLMQQERENGHRMPTFFQDEGGERTWEEFAAESAMSIGNMAPSVLTSMALNMLLPGAGFAAGTAGKITQGASLAVMGAGIAGNTYTEAINQGYSPSTAKTYAYANAASEIGTELLFGGIEGMTGIGTDAATKALLGKTDNAILRFGIRVGMDGLGETMEEGVQAVIEPWMNNVILNKNDVLRGEDVAYSMLCGFMTGAVMSGPTIAVDEVSTYSRGKHAMGMGVNAEAVRTIADTFDSGTELKKLAGKIDSNAGAYTIGRALNEIDAGLSQQNIQDIAGYLVDKGIPRNVAQHNAQLLNYVALGGEMSQEQAKIVNEDKWLADAYREVVMNPESKVKQRSDAYREMYRKAETVSTDAANTQNGAEKSLMDTYMMAHGGEKRGAAAEAYSVSNDGRTSLKGKDGKTEDVRISGVEAAADGRLTLRLEDGRTVDAKDVSFASSGEAMLYAAVSTMDIRAEDANSLIAWANDSGVGMERYALGIQEAYRYGKMGIPYDQIDGSGFAIDLKNEYRKNAYNLGAIAAIEARAKQQKRNEGRAVSGNKTGKVILDGVSLKGRKLNEQQQAGMALARFLASAGMKVYVYESVKGADGRFRNRYGSANGTYMDRDGSIHIDLAAGNSGEGTMAYTISHEFTHFIEDWSGEKFRIFANALFEELGKAKVDVDAMVEEKLEQARGRKEYKGKTEEQLHDIAYSEVVAECCETMLTDTDALKKLSANLKAKDQTLWNKIAEFFRGLADRLKKAYKDANLSPDSEIANQAKDTIRNVERLSKLWAEAGADAITSFNAAAERDTGAKKAAVDGGVKYHARQMGYDYGKPFSEQIDDWKKGKIPSNDALLVGTTPNVFQDLGLAKLPVTINQTHVDYALNGTKDVDHAIGEFLLKRLPDLIREPMAIIPSDTHPTDSVVAILDAKHPTNGKPIIFAAQIDGISRQNNERLDTLAIKTVFGKGNAFSKLLADALKNESSKGFGIYYIDKNKTTAYLTGAGLQLPGSFRIHDGLIHTITDPKSPVKMKTLDATQSRQFKRWFGDWEKHPNSASKVVNDDGTPKIVYHQTSSDFTVFDPRHEGAGTRDSDTPFGIFLKSSDKDIGLKGGKQMALYASIKNPLVVQNRQDLTQKLSKLSQDYQQASEDLRKLNADYQQKFDDAKEAWRNYMAEWRKEHPDASRTALYDDEQFNKLFSAEDDVIDEWEAEARKIETRSKEAITRDIEANGYDGIIIRQDKGSFGRSTDAYIALHPEQVKSATDNIGTFDSQNPDIRYSDRGYSYDALVSKPDMVVATVGRNVPKNRADVIVQAKKNAAKFGRFDTNTGSVIVHVDDIDSDVIIGRDGLKHSMDRRFDVNAPVVLKAGEIISNSICINELSPKKESASESYVLIGAAKNDRGELYIVRSVVNRFRNELTSMDVLYAINAKKEPAALLPLSAGNPALGTDSTVSISRLLDYVNEYFPDILPENVLKHYGYDARPDGDLGEDALYSDRDDGGMSNRELLANALEETVQSDGEARMLAQYKEQIQKVSQEQQKLGQLKKQIQELTFGGGKKDAAKLKALKEEAIKTANRIGNIDRKLLTLESTQSLKNLLDRERKNAMQYVRKQNHEAVERRNKTEVRNMLKRTVKELNDYLLNESKTKHVPEEMKAAVAVLLDSVNMDSVSAARRIAELQKKMDKTRSPGRREALNRQILRLMSMGAKTEEKLKNLHDAYEKLYTEAIDTSAYDEFLSEKILEAAEIAGDTPIMDMTREQLESVNDIFRAVLHRIREANRTFADSKKARIADISEEVMRDFGARARKRYASDSTKAIRQFFWNNEKSVYAFERIGSPALMRMYENLRKGEDVWAVDIQEARSFYRECYDRYYVKNWHMDTPYSFESTSGMRFTLTLEQIMSLYAYSKREQARDHIRKGGIVIDENTRITVKGMLGVKRQVNVEDATTYNISDQTLGDIIGTLTEQQKGFVDDMQSYMSDTMGAKGNEVAMAMYGIRIFKEKNYFPLKSAEQYKATAKEQKESTAKIKNSGFTKATVKKASNPIVLSSFFDVWANHVNDMSMYHAFVLPMEDFYRVYNYRTKATEEGAMRSVQALMENACGKEAVTYVDQFLKDLNGGLRADPRESLTKAMMAKFKKASVFASASVVIQQPSAIGRAFSVIDPKFFVGEKLTEKKHKALWEECKRYAPIAIIKEMGYFDTNMGKSTADYLTAKGYKGAKEIAEGLLKDSGYRDEVLSIGPSLADEVTWTAIWEACKREAKVRYSLTGEAMLQKAGERFTEVITKTQVYDSVFSRSSNMRSKSGLMSMLTAFMAEPTTSINMLESAMRKWNSGDRKAAVKTSAAVLTSVILNSILVSFVYAARDDDDDKNYLEKYLSSFTSEIMEGFNPLTYIPLVKDVWSLLQGYNVERADLSLIADIIDSMNSFAKLAMKDTSGMSDEQLKEHHKSLMEESWKLADGFFSMMGVPEKNIRRDIHAVINMCKRSNWGKSSPRTVWEAVKETAMKNIPFVRLAPKDSKADRLYDAVISGDAVSIDRAKGKYKDQESIDSAMRTAIQGRLADGELDEDAANEQLVQYGGMESDDAYWKVAQWQYETENDDDFEKYGAFWDAVKSGKNLKAVIREYTDNGVSEATLSSQITSHFRPEYVKMSASERANIKGYLLNAMTETGKTREEAEKTMKYWDFEANNGFDYNEKLEMYCAGKITRVQLKAALMEMDDMYSAEADREIVAYDYIKAHPNTQLSITTAKSYTRSIENCDYTIQSSGLSEEQFLSFREKKALCNGTDSDGDGTRDSGSVQAQVVPIIDAMPISNAQKDTLWYFCGWSKKTLRNAPWHRR